MLNPNPETSDFPSSKRYSFNLHISVKPNVGGILCAAVCGPLDRVRLSLSLSLSCLLDSSSSSTGYVRSRGGGPKLHPLAALPSVHTEMVNLSLSLSEYQIHIIPIAYFSFWCRSKVKTNQQGLTMGMEKLHRSCYYKGLNNYQYHFEVHLRHHRRQVYKEYGAIILLII